MTASNDRSASAPSRRRRWMRWIVVPAIAGAAIGAALAARVTPVYKSETLVRVVPPRLPESFVSSTASHTVESFEMITQQISSRTRLERIIQEFDLYREERRRTIMEDVIQQMRDNIEVTIESLQSGDGVTLRIGFSGAEPERVRKVTERLALMFNTEHLRQQEYRAESTHTFLKSSLEDTRQRLVEKGARLRAVRAKRAPEAETASIEYEVLETTFRDLFAKVEEARAVAAGGASQLGENLQLIEGARRPERPIAPDWRQYIGTGAGSGAALGMLILLFAATRSANRPDTGHADAPESDGSLSS